MIPVPGNGRVDIERLLVSAPEQVFAAWTDPARIVDWFCPFGMRLTVERMDVRPGGHYEWHLCGAAGEHDVITGEYLLVDAPLALEFTWTVRLLRPGADQRGAVDDTLVSVTLAPAGAGTRLRLVHRRLPRQSTVDGHRDGWDACLRNLARDTRTWR